VGQIDDALVVWLGVPEFANDRYRKRRRELSPRIEPVPLPVAPPEG